METSVLIAGIAAVLLLVGTVLVVLVMLLLGRGRSRRELLVAQAETAELRERLEDLSARLESQAATMATTMVRVDDPAYVITDAGAALEPNVQDRVVLTATVGEPLVKAVAFGHGLRRALSAESRNKIWFEMGREVRRARKQRRREMKQAWRREQAEDRSTDTDLRDPHGSASAA
ncbi:MAG: hypothetical protein ABIN79_00180 [Marmoricola sp.]